MYDTVAALLREPPQSAIDALPWKRRSTTVTEHGVRETWSGGNPGEAHFILHPDGRLKVERSLPKCLTGQNAEDLSQSDVVDALAALDAEIDRASGGGLPPVAEWSPCRVDYCRSHDLESPELVDLALGRLAEMTVPRKGRPVVGTSGSVAWPKGAMRPKFYNKGREDGVPAHHSLLRFEVGVFGSRKFSEMPGALPDRTWSDDRPAARSLRLINVLTPGIRTLVLNAVMEVIGGLPVNVDDLADDEFFDAFVSYFGLRRASAILGYGIVWRARGVRTAADLPESQRPTYYRVMADVRRFRATDHSAGEADDVRWLLSAAGVRAAGAGS